MKARLQERLPKFSENQLIIIDLKIGHTSYKTYRNPASARRSTLSICYHLWVEDPSTHQSGEQILYAKVYLENRSQDKFVETGNGPFVIPRFGASFAYLPDLDMIVWAFPNDPVLAHLPQCIDPERVSEYFPYENLPPGLNASEDIISIEVKVIHYRPETRCMTRYTLKWGKRSESNETVLFGKTFKDNQGEVLYQRSLAIYQESQQDDDYFLIAPPLAYTKEIKTYWQVGLTGKAMVNFLNNKNYQALLESIGKGLAHFHQSSLVSPLRVTIPDHVREIHKKIGKLIGAFPQFKTRLKLIGQNLEREGLNLSPGLNTVIHADFSLQQLLVCGERIACFDFDEMAMGDPIQDIANFIVDCHVHAFEAHLIPLFIAAFVRAYEKNAGASISRCHLIWYIQLLFITKAYRFYLQQEPQLEPKIEEIIALVEQESTRDWNGM